MTSNIELKNAKPAEKDYAISVDTGLSLLIKTTGSKLWRYRYSYGNKRCMISVGKYPQISLKDARAKVRGYADMLDQGINPSTHKKVEKVRRSAEKSFKEVALAWHKKHYKDKNERYSKLVKRRLEKYIFPKLGDLPIDKIEAPMLFNIVEHIQSEDKVTTGKCVNSYCSMTFRYGVAKGYCKMDVTQHYKGMLETAKENHMPTLKTSEEVGELLYDIDQYNGSIVTQIAFKLSPYVMLRPSELAYSEWDFIDWENNEWFIPARLMKMKRDHLIPFPKQVRELLLELQPITSNQKFIFPAVRKPNSPMNAETINKSLRRIDDGKYIGRMVSHGFRGMASTILNEHKFRPDVIEMQLAHVESNKVRGAYNHAQYLQERRDMLAWLANHLDGLKAEHIKQLT